MYAGAQRQDHSMKSYKAVFTNKSGRVDTEVFEADISAKEMLPFVAYGVTVDTDGFECLAVNAEQYSERQLAYFDYEHSRRQNLLLLQNYTLETAVPVCVFDRNASRRSNEILTITMTRGETAQTSWHYELLGTVYQNAAFDDMQNCLLKLQEKLDSAMLIEICACCKKSHWNPYGGSDFFNQVCLKSAAEEYFALENKDDKKSLGHFMMTHPNFERTWLVNHCEEFCRR
jgi:hypothetical protein